MTLLNQFWNWINPMNQTRLLVLELNPLDADYLTQIAANMGTSRQEAAQDLLKTVLVERQVSEAYLERWQALTPRQQQVAALACLNFTNRQIAAHLGISPQTVKSHMYNLLHRFELNSKAELSRTLSDWDFSEWI